MMTLFSTVLYTTLNIALLGQPIHQSSDETLFNTKSKRDFLLTPKLLHCDSYSDPVLFIGHGFMFDGSLL